jgi:electron transfer flavoprotein alpha subunit
VLDTLGLKSEAEHEWTADLPAPALLAVDKPSIRDSGLVFVLLGTDASGRLRPSDVRQLRFASSLARFRRRELAALVLAPDDHRVLSRLVQEMGRHGASSVTLATVEDAPLGQVSDELWSRVVSDRWLPEWSAFGAIVASRWSEPTLARFGARQANLVLRVSQASAGPNTLVVRCPHIEGRIDYLAELPIHDSKPVWLTTTDGVTTELPLAPAVAEPYTEKWSIRIEQLPGRRELMELLDELRREVGVTSLAQAEFIIDVGYGIGGRDGLEEIVFPLERLLREIGVAHIALGASRKVTEELKLLPASAQIGQTGQSVNPLVMLALGISGAPQHLNYVGDRATIVAFNRDAEAPIMTLALRRPRPRVFPVVGDLFQTVPAFMAALREAEKIEPARCESAFEIR